MVKYSNDNPADSCKKALAFGLILLIILVGGATISSAQQTDAEKASLSERSLTTEEKATRTRGCTLPKPSGSVKIANRDVRVVELGEMVFLKVLSAKKDAVGINVRKNYTLLPLLPVGGIGARDFCESSVLLPMSDVAQDGQAFVTLFLRGGLDIQQDYPSSISQIQENQQIFTLSAGKYIVFSAKYGSEIEALEGSVETISMLNRMSEFAANGTSFWLRNTLFVPLASGSGS